MIAFDPWAEFEHLLRDFGPAWRPSTDTKSPIPEDDAAVQIALAGFSRHADLRQWKPEHAEFIQQRRAAELSDAALAWYEEAAPSVAAFACLVLGSLLGRYVQGQINDADFLHADALLLGFLMQENERIQ